MKIAYGPPGVQGVTTLMSVGDVEEGSLVAYKAGRWGEWAGMGLWGYGWATKNQELKKIGGGIAIAGLLISLFSKPR